MNYESTISSKGQITIPKTLRDILDIKEGDKLDLSLSEDRKTIEVSKINVVDKNDITLNIVKSIFETSGNVCVVIEGVKGVGKSFLAKELVKEKEIFGSVSSTQVQNYKGKDSRLNEGGTSLKDLSGLIYINDESLDELKHIDTINNKMIITTDKPIDIESDIHFVGTNRPILYITLSEKVNGLITKASVYINKKFNVIVEL